MNKKFKSEFCDQMVSANKYIAEIICSYNAAKNGIDLPRFFWRIPHWQQFYRLQLIKINSVLLTYNPSFVIYYVRKKKIWNLMPKWIEDDMQKEHREWQCKRPTLDSNTQYVKNPTFKEYKATNIDYLDG